MINIYRMNIIILLHKCFNYFSVLFIFLIGGKEKHNFLKKFLTNKKIEGR